LNQTIGTIENTKAMTMSKINPEGTGPSRKKLALPSSGLGRRNLFGPLKFIDGTLIPRLACE
jgi:hypothetical protein